MRDSKCSDACICFMIPAVNHMENMTLPQLSVF